MRELYFTQFAKENLTEMLRYGTYQWGENGANAFLDAFIKELDLLRLNPDVGRRDGIDRIWPHHKYKIRYGYDTQQVTIIAIIPKGRPLE